MAEGVPLHRLAQLMGHDSLDTTTLYVRGTMADLQAAVEGNSLAVSATISWKKLRTFSATIHSDV